MAENLNVSRFQNGDLIPEAQSEAEWKRAGENKQPAWCYYDNDSKNGDKYGRLYNWYAVADASGLCPLGWHIPSDAEWSILVNYLGGKKVAGGKMKALNNWNAPNTEASNESKFNGFPGGNRSFNGSFNVVETKGAWWSSTEYETYFAWYRDLSCSLGASDRLNCTKRFGFSVRCIKD